MPTSHNLKNDWFFPDAYLPNPADGISHEAVCVLNTGSTDARIELVLYFEDREQMEGFTVLCPAKRTKHIRMEKLRNIEGKTIPPNQAYAVWVHSDQPVFCQYTRVDAAVPPRTMMTAMGL